MKHNQVTEIKPLVKTKFLSAYEAKYKNKAGKDKSWIIATRKSEETLKNKFFGGEKDSNDAVAIAALHKPTNKLVIIKQFRIPVNDFVYELTAGLIDPGEDYKTAVIREMKEETGLDITEVLGKKDRMYLSPGMTDECISFTYCICEGEISTSGQEDDECIIPVMVSQEEAKELLKEDSGMDVKCYLILKAFAEQGASLFENL